MLWPFNKRSGDRPGGARRTERPRTPGHTTRQPGGQAPLQLFQGDDLTLFTSASSHRAIGLKDRPRMIQRGPRTATYYGHDLTRHTDVRGRRKPLPHAAHRQPLGRVLLGAVVTAFKWLFSLKIRILIIERYIWTECIGNFALGAMGFTFFMLITSIFGLGEKIFQKNIPPYTIAKVLILTAPAFLVLAIPVAVVFSTLMAMGRLNRDNEIVAFTTNGVSLYRIFIPFLAMSIFAAYSTWFIYENVVPPNNAEYKTVLKVFWHAQVVDFIKPGIIIKAPERKYFYVDEIRREKVETPKGSHYESFMYGIRLYDYHRYSPNDIQLSRDFPRVFLARKAWIEDQFLVLGDVKLYNLDEAKGNSLVGATMPEVRIDIGTRIKEMGLDPHPTEMRAYDLRNRIFTMRDRIMSAPFPNPGLQKKYYMNWTEYYFKYAIPFACIALCLVAVPVSLTGPRDERNLGIIMSFILVMIYYIIFFVSRTLGSRGIELMQDVSILGQTLIPRGTNMFPPYIAGWMPSIIFFTAAIFLFWRARK